jgi:hypothetical protein
MTAPERIKKTKDKTNSRKTKMDIFRNTLGLRLDRQSSFGQFFTEGSADMLAIQVNAFQRAINQWQQTSQPPNLLMIILSTSSMTVSQNGYSHLPLDLHWKAIMKTDSRQKHFKTNCKDVRTQLQSRRVAIQSAASECRSRGCQILSSRCRRNQSRLSTTLVQCLESALSARFPIASLQQFTRVRQGRGEIESILDSIHNGTQTRLRNIQLPNLKKDSSVLALLKCKHAKQRQKTCFAILCAKTAV